MAGASAEAALLPTPNGVAAAPAPPADGQPAGQPAAHPGAHPEAAPAENGAAPPSLLAWLPSTAAMVALRLASLDAAVLLEPHAPPARERLQVRLQSYNVDGVFTGIFWLALLEGG